MPTPPPSPTRPWALLAVLAGGVLPACQSPIEQRTEQDLRRAALASIQRQVQEADANAQRRRLEPRDDVARLEIRPEQLDEIERDYSLPAYLARLERADADPIEALLGENLYGRPHEVVGVGLLRAVAASVEHNLDVESARYRPAIRESDVVAAEAAFDWLLTSSVAWEDVDTPQPGPGFLALGPTTASTQTVTWNAGLSRLLTTGATVGLSQRLRYEDERNSAFGTTGDPNPASTLAFDFELAQPLLRGFGSETNLAQVRVAQNAERAAISSLRERLIVTVTTVEDAYWELAQRYNELVIRARLLEQGEAVREDVKARRVLDARQAQVADAVARVESRRADVLRARTALRRASDRLKALINDPALPVGGEILIIPADPPPDVQFEYSLAELVADAIAQRPEIERAILDIDDASIRQTAAKNASLPRLDLRARLTLAALDADAAGAYDQTFESEFIDGFLLGLDFEQPIGNRGPEAALRRARLERMQSVVDFRAAVQQVVLEVKDALDQVALNRELIVQARLTRIAQAEALRTLMVDKEFDEQGYSVTRLDLEFTQQDALARALIEEIGAVIDYSRALAELHRATGTSLARNRIDFVVPDLNQVEPGDRALDYRDPADPDESASAPLP